MGSSNSLQRDRLSKVEQRNTAIKQHIRVVEARLVELKINEQLLDKITNSTATQLVQLLNKGQLTSEQITAAYAYRAGTSGMTIRAITEDNFLEALKMAKQCDQTRRTSMKKNWVIGNDWDMNKYLPPLFGIPISVKDSFDLQGFASTIGLSARVNQIKKDGLIAKAVKNSGQIPFVRTNLPQFGMSHETNNFVWGRSVNPWNNNRAVGGSSGGQASLIAARGSPLGIGSDIGGSLRVPAQHCGIFSFKPASGRISSAGHTLFHQSLDGNNVVPLIIGPMARCTDDLFLWMKSASQKQFYKGNHDAYVHYPKFEESKYLQAQKSKYKIGFISSLDYCQPSLASQRALRQTIDELRDCGHELTQVKLPNQKQVIRAFISFVAGEGDLKSYREMLNGEQFVQEYSTVSFLSRLNTSCYCCYACIHSLKNSSQPRAGVVLDGLQKKTTHQYFLNAGAIKRYKEEWINYLRVNNIDFVISPGFGCQAYVHGLSKDCSAPACYSYIWNLLNVPAGIVPITLVRKDQQSYESAHKDSIADILEKIAQNSQGLPVGVQVIGFPFDEQRVLGIMNTIDSRIKFNQKYGKPKV